MTFFFGAVLLMVVGDQNVLDVKVRNSGRLPETPAPIEVLSLVLGTLFSVSALPLFALVGWRLTT